MADLDFDDFESLDDPVDPAAADVLPDADAADVDAEPIAEAETAEKEPDGKKKKKKKEKKPKKEKKEKAEKDPKDAVGINPYTVMLCLTMLALAVGTFFLWLELNRYPSLKPVGSRSVSTCDVARLA